MGCVNSRPEFPNEVHPNVFTVTAISRPPMATENGSSSRNVATGQLEVTGTEIILHRRGHDPVHWPLQYIRRYGFENHLFSFESGRRCESGPGIFTFRCRHARELFLFVQRNVQETGSTTQIGPTTLAISNRLRSGSATSQNHFSSGPPAPPPLVGIGRSLNDYLSSDQPSGMRTNGHFLNSTSSSPPRRGSAVTDISTFDDTDGGQVFEEITPLRSSLIVEPRTRLRNDEKRQRLNSARSQTSSVASDHSLSLFTNHQQHQQNQNGSRPISFEFVLSPNESQATFLSPSQTNPSASPSPPSFAYYVNVAPPANVDWTPRKIDSQRHLSADRCPNGNWKPPARSHSLGSHGAGQDESQSDAMAGNGTYVNIVQCGSASSTMLRLDTANDTPMLDYVTLDVGVPSSHSPRRQFSHTDAGSSSNIGISLNSLLENGAGKRVNGKNDEMATISNYAQIDCTRTKALRETAAVAHMQRHSTSCSASSLEVTNGTDQMTTGRRSRLESAKEKLGSSQHKLFG